MDTVFYNGIIRTLDNHLPAAEAVAVKDGIIRYVGSSNEALRLAGPDARPVDLKGAALYPGFIDSHMHLLYSGYIKSKTDLSACTSFGGVMAAISEEAAKIRSLSDGKERWISAANFNQDLWDDRREIPDRADLDAAAGDVPCYICRVCGHIGAYNSRALQILGIESEYPDGIVKKSDNQPGDVYLNRFDKEDYKRWISAETKICAAMGLTSVHSDDLNLVNPGRDAETVMQVYKELGEKGLQVRVFEQCRLDTEEAIRSFAERYPRGTSFGKFKTVSVKEMADGSLGARSAYLIDGYPEGGHGETVHSDEEMRALVCAAADCGYPVVVHCIGDGAVGQALDAFETSSASYPEEPFRNGIVHCQIMRTEQLERMAAGNVLAYVQPLFIREDSAVVEQCVSPEIAEQSYDWRKMLDLGIHVSCGTDAPVEPCDPILNIWHAVTRTGVGEKPWMPEKAMSVEEAVRGYTVEGAYAAGQEKKLGTVTVGKYADFTVLDKDLFTVEPMEIKNTAVLMTVVGGEIVFSKENGE